MARPVRLALAGHLHHVIQRGHNRQAVFVDAEDRATYLAMLRDVVVAHGIAVHAYALLDAEVHLLLTPPTDPALGRSMQALGRRYVAAYNRRYGRTGTLWDGRFRAGIIESKHWLLDSITLIETLPEREHLVSHAADWEWSSARHHLGRLRDPLITEHPGYWSQGNTPFEREAAHAIRLAQGVTPRVARQLLNASLGGRASGSPRFVAGLEALVARPLHARPRGRPRRQEPD